MMVIRSLLEIFIHSSYPGKEITLNCDECFFVLDFFMMTKFFVSMIVFASILLSACTSAFGPGEHIDREQTTNPLLNATPTLAAPESTLVRLPSPTFLPEEAPPSGAAAEFSTDFSKHIVPYREIFSGGPPKDGIPAIDEPKFVDVKEADGWLKPVEPVILVEVGQQARAYPLQILIWHEIVNDTIGGLPLVVSFCPLCNTAIAFERDFNGKLLDFGTTGRLRYSNLIMYDRQTETWWQQATGEAIAGELAGSQLKFYPAAIISWQEFKAAHPDGKVLSRDTGFDRDYGRNPYVGYDDVNNPPFLYRGPQTPGVLPPISRVLTVDLNQEAVAYPYDILQKVHIVNDNVGGQPVVVFWEAGTASALDASSVADGKDVGTANAYLRILDGQQLNFFVEGKRILDRETGSEWNVLGHAIAGELQEKQLTSVIAINHFWFSWAAFKPETRVYQP
jgi:Protein of unknown function (DUF3179)